MNNLSLISIMRDDPEFGIRISKKVQEIKVDKEHLTSASKRYEEKYKQEILEGTELRNRLITEGTQKGLSEAEIIGSYGKFVPCLRTPLLNMLFFILRESDDDPVYGKTLYSKRDKINEHLIETKQIDHNKNNNLTESQAEEILNKFIDDSFIPVSSNVRKQVNSVFENEEPSTDSMKEPEKMEEFLYSNLTLDQFEILKKLKNLSQSNNINEATLAFRKGKELCEKYELNWEKIPCRVEKR